MKEKVKLLIVPLFHAVAVQSLYLDSRYNDNHPDIDSEHEASNEFVIAYGDSLELEGESISLYHDSEYPEDCVAFKAFADDTERDAWIVKLRDALADWSQNWEGFKESQTSDELSPGTGDKITIHV